MPVIETPTKKTIYKADAKMGELLEWLGIPIIEGATGIVVAHAANSPSLYNGEALGLQVEVTWTEAEDPKD